MGPSSCARACGRSFGSTRCVVEAVEERPGRSRGQRGWAKPTAAESSREHWRNRCPAWPFGQAGLRVSKSARNCCSQLMRVSRPSAVLDAPGGAFLRRRHLTIADARSDVLDYIKRSHNPRTRRLDALGRRFSASYYHASRTHRSLDGDCPHPRPVEPPDMGDVVAHAQVGGLHHRYGRRIAA